jgi:ribosomal protein L14E/L6E/L27E
MKDNYKKINGLRDFILGWIHKEACDNKSDKEVLEDHESYEKRRSNLNMLAGPDVEYVSKIIREHRYNKLTKAEMKKCNALKKKYSAISGVEFGEEV